jgi:murein DD-endopeptidase MepM/ murein hydrolase activator NlpD
MGPGLKILLGLVLVVVAVAGLFSLFGWGPDPEVEVKAGRPGIGPRTGLTVTVREPWQGVGHVRAVLRQGEREEVVAERQLATRPLWKLWGEHTAESTLDFELGKQAQPWLVNGQATLRVEAARPAGLLRTPPPVVSQLELPVRVVPPSLMVLSTQTYAGQGGSEAVVYRVGEGTTRHGVRAGDHFFPGAPVPGREGDQFVIFGIPWDLDDPKRIELVAADELGNEATRGFVERWTPRRIGAARIEVTQPFLQKVVPEIAGHSPEVGALDDLLAAYLRINGELREKNGQELLALGEKSRPEFLWRDAFLPFPSGQVMDAFAVRRTYVADGKEVDQQTHLGFDLASTQQAPVPAANRGVVMRADYFGIFGNCVVLDHGYGLMTLYAHLSSVDVQPGQTVERGQSLGRTGATGLAGGDHLHFATLVRGLPVTPVEWWDAHWIQDRIDRKLGAALPFGDAEPAPAGQAAPAAGASR